MANPGQRLLRIGLVLSNLAVVLANLGVQCSKEGITHWWDFESSSELLADSSGNNHTLSPRGTPTGPQFAGPLDCRFGDGCVLLDNSGVQTGNPAAIWLRAPPINFSSYAATGVSLSVWYRMTFDANCGRIWDFGDGSASIWLASPGCHSSNLIYRYPYASGGGSYLVGSYDQDADVLSPAPDLVDTSWRHFAATIAPDSEAKFYYNGELIFSERIGTGFALDPTLVGPENNIGGSWGSTDPAYGGYIDDFRIYNRVLNGSEVKLLYNIPSSCECDAGYELKLSEETGAVSCDLCGRGTYKNETSAEPCSLCPAGKFNNGTGALNKTACTVCEADSYSSAGSQSCLPCNVICSIGSSYFGCSPTTGVSTCTPCSNGPPNSHYISTGNSYIANNCSWSCNDGYHETGGQCETQTVGVEQLFVGNKQEIVRRAEHFAGVFDGLQADQQKKLDQFLLENRLVLPDGDDQRCWNISSVQATGKSCFDSRGSNGECP